MLINYGYAITIAMAKPTPIICLLDVHPERRADVQTETPFRSVPPVAASTYIDAFGNQCRRLMAPAGNLTLTLDGTIADNGQLEPVVPRAAEIPVERLPHDVIVYLLGSRYCETDRLSQIAWDLFGATPPGWTRVKTISDYVHNRIGFGYQHARATRTALEAHEERIGVCRDFAHLLITFCRCLNIPARYVNGYLGDIGVPADPAPMDFSAWVEVFLDGRWYTIDARHNKPRTGRIVVARGRDATDVPLINSFGPHTLKSFKVWTDEVAAPLFKAARA
jgi:transglutaminase-like putative cysteine protease